MHTEKLYLTGCKQLMSVQFEYHFWSAELFSDQCRTVRDARCINQFSCLPQFVLLTEMESKSEVSRTARVKFKHTNFPVFSGLGPTSPHQSIETERPVASNSAILAQDHQALTKWVMRETPCTSCQTERR